MRFGSLGFTHRSLRARVTHLLGAGYSTNQMSYDLARLRRTWLIEREAHNNTYTLTPDGQRVALFYTKVHNRLLRPLLAVDKPPHRRHCARHWQPSTGTSAAISKTPRLGNTA
ncbi:hypothetical protein [Arthrobacter ramosus]|uniref:HTH hxlR-type domain-containing protein n=1 Tax=Arthrobacter ramosus TaxID=1672 RepID=A0ABV5Y4J9_ARTRM|nr:hypothetical protein [Arthrobacter ramosus]